MSAPEQPWKALDRPAGPPNPFESYLLVICVIQGAAVVFGYARPPSIEGLLPSGLRIIWGALLLTGGLGAVVGLFWPGDPIDAILIKRVGLLGAAAGTLAYGVALIDIGPPGFVAAAFNIGFAIACLVRARQVTKALRDFRQSMQAIRNVVVDPLDDPPGSP